jgi:hypothetical protein
MKWLEADAEKPNDASASGEEGMRSGVAEACVAKAPVAIIRELILQQAATWGDR